MPLDNLITRLPNGVNNKFENDAFMNLKVPDVSNYHFFFDDFDKYLATQWVVGGVNTEVIAIAAGDGGLLSMATGGANNDNAWIQQQATAWTLSQAKRTLFRARAQADVVATGELVFGLQIAVAADNILTPADGLFLVKADGAATFVLQHRVGGVAVSSAASPAIVAGTPFELAFATDGLNVIAALNGQVWGSITVPAFTTAALRVTAGVQAGAAAVSTMLLDQLTCYKER